jgi:hypothetical protein
VEDDLEMAAGQRRGGVADSVAPADYLDLTVTLQGFPELGEPVAAARDEDANLLARRYRGVKGHR